VKFVNFTEPTLFLSSLNMAQELVFLIDCNGLQQVIELNRRKWWHPKKGICM